MDVNLMTIYAGPFRITPSSGRFMGSFSLSQSMRINLNYFNFDFDICTLFLLCFEIWLFQLGFLSIGRFLARLLGFIFANKNLSSPHTRSIQVVILFQSTSVTI